MSDNEDSKDLIQKLKDEMMQLTKKDPEDSEKFLPSASNTTTNVPSINTKTFGNISQKVSEQDLEDYVLQNTDLAIQLTISKIQQAASENFITGEMLEGMAKLTDANTKALSNIQSILTQRSKQRHDFEKAKYEYDRKEQLEKIKSQGDIPQNGIVASREEILRIMLESEKNKKNTTIEEADVVEH